MRKAGRCPRWTNQCHAIQGLNCEDAKRKDLLIDVGTEEPSHLEVVRCLARLHLEDCKRAGIELLEQCASYASIRVPKRLSRNAAGSD